MTCNVGDVLLVKFPFTNLKKSKKRPVLVVKPENNLQDIVCFQITSNATQTNLLKILKNDLKNTTFNIQSYIKYDKCFTLSMEIVDKKIGEVSPSILKDLQKLFCDELF